MTPADDKKQQILKYLKQHGPTTSKQLCAHLGISRQALNVHIRTLITAGKLYKSGATRAAKYHLNEAAPQSRRFKKTLRLASLDEHQTYELMATLLNLRSALPANLQTIVNYGFTEILNNAIDHSKAKTCEIEVHLDAAKIEFEIRDRGIGVFHSIASRFRLEDEHAAMIELIKGKTTTMPEAHSGEGIFFSAQAADRFALRSHQIEIVWDKFRQDIFVSQPRYLEGTRVRFTLLRSSRTKLEDVFSRFAPREYDFEFSRTRIMVKLLQAEYISRSEAKRLVVNLEKFREVELDFRGVDLVGQGFADELFRVFQSRHADTKIETTNTNAAVEAMIRHVIQSVRAT
ncbi:MAG: DUF4325 domain-containing protein [Gammaproteobacteria bacterium]|nr:DUF4325 domain-containing protein [Gammaproteobacteria bacterium]